MDERSLSKHQLCYSLLKGRFQLLEHSGQGIKGKLNGSVIIDRNDNPGY